jgi:D-alanyl-D-alanine dipeptidase
VDLTLVDALGNELAMPTAFDEFTPKAHRDFMDLDPDVVGNRALLQSEMEKEGFIGLPTEWWHFDSPEWSLYALRDEPLGSKSLHKDVATMPNLNVPDSVKQLVVVNAKEWSSTKAFLQRYEKVQNKWKKIGPSWEVSLGSKGLINATEKKEGDLMAPAGVFKIGSAYGASLSAPSGSHWPYQPLSEGWVCVDDPKSTHYNRVFSPDPSVKKDWSSAETMLRTDHLYKWVINIEHNINRTAGCGSCIFFHVWRKPGSPTEGCTAMEEKNILTLLAWLDPAQNPHLLQGPDTLITQFLW